MQAILDSIEAFFWTIMPNVMEIPDLIIKATNETLYMTIMTCLIAFPLGIALGFLMVLSMPNGLKENRSLYSILDKLVNIFRSIPFVILIALLVGLTRWIVGTSIGTTATLVPLIVSTIPFYARQVQNILVTIDRSTIEAAESMGLSTWEIVTRVYLREALPDLIRTSAVSIISVIGLTAMAGTVAGGGLGTLAITRGYNRMNHDVTIVATVIILLIVFVFQSLSDFLANRIDHSQKQSTIDS